MMIFDLRLIVLAVLALLALCAGLAAWAGYRPAQRASRMASRAKDDTLADLRQRQDAAQQALRQLTHEVRAPLTTIRMQVEIARIPEIPAKAREAALKVIQAEAQQTTRLIEALADLGTLDLSDNDEAAARPVNLTLIAEEAVAQALPRAEERQIALTLHADPNLPLIPGDANRLKQVFLNLLDNAVKYCRPGDRAEVSLTLARARDAIACEVRDTGPGIPKAHLPYVTQRLYRAQADVEGSGLGLAIVEAILRRHGSRLTIESETEGDATGTTFRLKLPLYPH